MFRVLFSRSKNWKFVCIERWPSGEPSFIWQYQRSFLKLVSTHMRKLKCTPFWHIDSVFQFKSCLEYDIILLWAGAGIWCFPTFSFGFLGGQWVTVGLCYIHRCCPALVSGQQCFCCNVDSDDLQFIILVTTYDELPEGTISIISVMILSCSAMSISVFLGIHELTTISFGV